MRSSRSETDWRGVLYTYTPAVQNMATVPKPPSMLARTATVDSLTVPFGRLEREVMRREGKD